MVPSNYISILVFSVCMIGAIVLGNSLAAEDMPGIAITLGLFSLIFIRQEVLLFLFVAVSCSGLSLPHIPSPFDVPHLLLCALIPLTIATRIIRGGLSVIGVDFLWLFVPLIIGWVWFIAFRRGWSLHFMGGGMQGGTLYLSWTLNLLSILVLRATRMAPKYWRVAMAFFFLGNLVPALMDEGTQMGITALQGFVQGSDNTDAENASADLGDSSHRYVTVGFAAYNLFYCLIFFVPLRTIFSLRGWWTWPVIIGLLFLTAVGGFRNLLITMALFVFFQLLLERMFTPPLIMSLIIVSSVGYTLLYECVPSLPYDVQRCVSFVPGIPVDPSVRGDAQATIDWRVNLWQEAAKDLPRYAVVGKGFTYSKDEINKLNDLPGDNTVPVFIAMNEYHNGPLSLLLCLGIPGFLLVTVLFIGVAVRHLRHARRESGELPPRWRHLHRSLLAYYMTLIAAYYLIYGDIYAAIVPMFLTIGFLESVWGAMLAANRERLEARTERPLVGSAWPGRAIANMPLAHRTR